MSSRIHSTFNRSTLRRLAGLRSFERGAQYALTGRVRKMKDADDEVTATVAGTRPYRVRLWVEEGGPAFSCTCPMGDEGAFCKHCVALGLTLLERGDTSLLSSPAEPATADLRPYLEAQDKEALVELVLAQAQEDELLRGRLLLEATKTAGTQVDLDGYRQAIDRVIMVDDYVDYRSMYDYAQGVEEVVESLEELLASRHAAEVIALTEHAMEAVEDALGRVDDSDGYLGSICDRLVKLHHAACLEARPDTPALAERLFGWGLNSEWETFLTAGADYADVLGEEGLEAYRHTAEAVWSEVPSRGPGDERDRSGHRFRISYIMETLARLADDPDQLVDIKARELSSAYRYLEIAEILRQAGRDEEALSWAERGREAFPERTDTRLREFLAEAHQRRGRYNEALALIWEAFSESPTLTAYQRLDHHATRANRWSTWRERALGLLRERAAEARASQKPPPRWELPSDHSTLVQVFLWEGDIEAAWAEAVEGDCSERLWMELAGLREDDHPAEVLPVYQTQVERTVHQKNNRAYAEAVRLLERIEGLMSRLGRDEEFGEYVAGVRAAHKPKRNFMKLLDQTGW
ncbi:MAG: SWIM zinc finger family protein [Acidimicrobiia bacterium]